MEENKKPQIALSNSERFPLISKLDFLQQMQQDQHAPLFNFASGDRLQQHHLDEIEQYSKSFSHPEQIKPSAEPEFIKNYLKECLNNVPYYKNYSETFSQTPSLHKEQISQKPWLFVGNKAAIDEMLVYQTSGTTGAPMDVNFSPASQAAWLVQLESILDRHNITIERSPKKVALALICCQEQTLTYASLSTLWGSSGVLKINLNPSDWNTPADRQKYLEKYQPQILTGDPFAFLALKELKPKLRPKALVSSAMLLNNKSKEELEEYFKCPVFDIYSMTECRMIAVRENDKYRSIRPDLYFEIFDPNSDKPLPLGEKGELVISGGNNPFLHLLRYRTGDYCKLEIIDGVQYLCDLQAREPVSFYTRQGKFINNIDISRALSKFSLAGFRLHQNPDFSLCLNFWASIDSSYAINSTLQQIFGNDIEISLTAHPLTQIRDKNKTTSFTSDIPEPAKPFS